MLVDASQTRRGLLSSQTVAALLLSQTRRGLLRPTRRSSSLSDRRRGLRRASSGVKAPASSFVEPPPAWPSSSLLRRELCSFTLRRTVRKKAHKLTAFVPEKSKFSKAAGRVKELVSSLPVATEDEDIEEAVALKEETKTASENGEIKQVYVSAAPVKETSQQDSDPFGLDALIPNAVKKGEKTKGKKEATAKSGDGQRA